MHECPNCGQACDCDMEDVWHVDSTSRAVTSRPANGEAEQA